MNKRLLVPLVALVGLIILAYYFGPGYGQRPNTQKNNEGYKNTTYEIDGRSIKLENGLSVMEIAPGSASMLTTEYFGNIAKGDLNNDSIPDLAFLLTQSGGGSGTFFYVVAALQNSSGSYRGTNAILLGDRIAPQTTEINNGELIVNYADRNPNDPMTTSPSMGVSKFLKIEGNKLVVGLER